MTRSGKLISVLVMLCLLAGCSSARRFPAVYYRNNEAALEKIRDCFDSIYKATPISVEFTDKQFENVSLSFITDSIKYIYQFNTQEPRLQDTLRRYHINAANVTRLLDQMKAIRCTWINNLPFYQDGKEQSLTYISIRQKLTNRPFATNKYFILTYFEQPQYFDEAGNLLATRKLRKLRKISNETFRRINNRVCYTVSEKFR